MNRKILSFLALLCAACLLVLASCRAKTPEINLPNTDVSSQSSDVSQAEPDVPEQKGEIPRQNTDPAPQTPNTPAALGQNPSTPEAIDVDLGWNSFAAQKQVDPPTVTADPTTRAAFASMLEGWDGPAQFAVCDVNGDTLEELVILSGGLCRVFQYDADFGILPCALEESEDTLFFDNGSAVSPWSHNAGKGGRFWPYVHYRFDPGYQLYRPAGNVDAFDRQVAEDNDFLDLYPQDVDTSNSGFVYYFINGEGGYSDPVDLSYYQAWWDGYFKDASPMKLPLKDLTAANISALT